MTRYDDMDESGGGISVSGHAPGSPRPALSDSRGDTDWELALYGPGSEDQAPRTDRYRGSGAGSGGGRPDGGRSRGRRPSWRAMLGAAAIIATFAVVATSLVAYAKYRGVVGSIHREKVTAAMLGKRPPLTAGLNILVIGSDSRQGLGAKFGADVLGARSDTSMLLHIAPGHTRADIISFPRDSMVPVLACADDKQGHPGQSAQPGELERLNSTFSAGGAPCLWKTLEQETGIRIQHFVEVNFAGFQSIVNDVGGVPVCLPFAINNPQSRLRLAAGKHVVSGAQALAFVRLRENVGEGSDTQRIQRQQYFLAAVMQKLKSTNLLSQPSRIFNVVRDVAKSLTTDSGLDLSTMLRIANSMKSLSSSSVQLVTVPVVPYAGDPAAELSWEQPQSARMFRAIERDKNLPATAKAKATGQGEGQASHGRAHGQPGHGARPGAERVRCPGRGRHHRLRPDRQGLRRDRHRPGGQLRLHQQRDPVLVGGPAAGGQHAQGPGRPGRRAAGHGAGHRVPQPDRRVELQRPEHGQGRRARGRSRPPRPSATWPRATAASPRARTSARTRPPSPARTTRCPGAEPERGR